MVVLGSNLELGENGKDTVALYWFRPLESKSYVQCGRIMRGREVPSNGALGRLIWPAG
jgi:hypothetical protein